MVYCGNQDLSMQTLAALKANPKIEQFLYVRSIHHLLFLGSPNPRGVACTKLPLTTRPPAQQQCSRRPECRSMDLSSFLIKPIQRICKYPLLLRVLFRPMHLSKPFSPLDTASCVVRVRYVYE
jgi:hypothetical protein